MGTRIMLCSLATDGLHVELVFDLYYTMVHFMIWILAKCIYSTKPDPRTQASCQINYSGVNLKHYHFDLSSRPGYAGLITGECRSFGM